MPLSNVSEQALDRFVGGGPRRDSLDILPNDTLVELLSCHLDLLDVLRMRQVSKLYYGLTHHAVVWKRLLRRIDIPLPPVPPTSRHTSDRMTALEVERLLCRAYSLHLNWERRYPRCLREWSFEAFHRVHEMTLLPGGRYLVASVSDYVGKKHALMIYALDTMGRSRPIAKTDTLTKVFAIRAKYVTIKGEKSIAIAYLRRDYHHKTDKRKVKQGILPDPSEYSTYHTVDADIRFRHECVALHARLSTLEALADLPWEIDTAQFIEEAKLLPPPFENLVRVVSRPEHRLMCPDIEEVFDSAYLSVVKSPNDIVFKRLDGGPPATLTCMPVATYTQFAHTIMAARLLPSEGSIFVVRKVDVPRTPTRRYPIYAFEKYHVIPSGHAATTQLRWADVCLDTRDMNIGHLSHVYIADPNLPPRHDDSILGQIRDRASEPPLALPLTVYARRENEEGLVLVQFFALRRVLELPPTPPSAAVRRGQKPAPMVQRVEFTYTLDNSKIYVSDSDPNKKVRILPGVLRPLLVYTPWDDITDYPPILEIRPWVDVGMHGPYKIDEDGYVVPEVSKRIKRWFDDEQWEGLHAAAYAWDETIGRLVIIEQGSEDLRVYDFAAAPRYNETGQRLPVPHLICPNPDVLKPPASGRLLDIAA